MRYEIMKPHMGAMDPRRMEFDSLIALGEVMPTVSSLDLEQSAACEVRRTYPDALAMPVPVQVGSGTIYLLGFVTNPDFDAALAVPFALFVRAIPENNRDKVTVQRHQQFRRELWRPPVLRPPVDGLAREFPVQIRATDLEQYGKVAMQMFVRENGRTVLYAEVGGVEISIEFQERGLALWNMQKP